MLSIMFMDEASVKTNHHPQVPASCQLHLLHELKVLDGSDVTCCDAFAPLSVCMPSSALHAMLYLQQPEYSHRADGPETNREKPPEAGL